MKPIGSKTITATVIFSSTLWAAERRDLLRMERLQAFTPQAAVFVGLFAVLIGTWFYLFWSFGSPSRSYFRFSARGSQWEGEQALLGGNGPALLVGRVDRDFPRELPPWALGGLSLGISLFVALLCFDARTVRVMLDAPRKLANAGARFCPSEDQQLPPPITRAKPGCELIYRAFELGYVKSLGDCAPDSGERKIEVCTLRQPDEPYLHYSARIFMAWVDHARETLGAKDLKQRIETASRLQLAHLGALAGKLEHIVAGAPKASHHIFTNLPYPTGMAEYYYRRWFDPDQCLLRDRGMPHTIAVDPGDPTSRSKVAEHVFQQLLFNRKYEEAAGDCKEITIHWSFPADSCDRLASNPEAFLKEASIAGEVRTVYDRLNENREVRELDAALLPLGLGLVPRPSIAESALPRTDAGDLKARAEASPDTVLSFQCLMQAASPEQAGERVVPFELFGRKFRATEVRFAAASPDLKRIHVGMYRNMSEALARGFRYAGYQSHEALDVAQQTQARLDLLDGDDLPLTRLEYLKTVDVFLDGDWLQDRDDLLELYPYYHHLYHYISLFRRQFRLERSRL